MLRKLLQQSLIYFTTLVGGKLLSAVYFMILARVLLPDRFGEVMLFTTLVQLVTTIFDVGLKNWYLKQSASSKQPALLGQLLAWRLSLAVISILVMMVIQWWWSPLPAGVSSYFWVSLFFESLITVADSYYLACGQSLYLGYKLIVRNLLFFASLWLIRTPADINYFYQSYLLTWTLIIIFYFPWRAVWTSWCRGCQHWPNIWSTWPYAAIDSLGVIYSRADQLIINSFLDTYALGLYGAAYRYLDAFNLLPQALFHNLFPLAAKKGGLSRRQIVKMVVVMTAAGLAVAVAMVTLSQFLTVTLLGADYAPAAGILRLLAVVVVLFFFNAPLNTVLQSGDRVACYVPFLLGSTLANLGLNWWLVPRLGMYGSVWAMIGGECLLVIVNIYLVWRQTKHQRC